MRWPEPRFEEVGSIIVDRLTNLGWRSSADLTGRPSTWEEALKAVTDLNRHRGGTYSWRLPNINELESLVDCNAHSPALPQGHPFRDVREGYWSSTTSLFEPDWAWALYLTKGAVGVGQKKGRPFLGLVGVRSPFEGMNQCLESASKIDPHKQPVGKGGAGKSKR